jgi:hypothetical protein
MRNQLSIFVLAPDKKLRKHFIRHAHGGDLALGKRKLDRPLSTKRPIHLVLRAQQARGKWSFLGFKNRVEVERIVRRQARKFGVIIQDFANVGNHLHIRVRAGSRAGFQAFLRSITCLIARKVTGARRGFKLGKKFWDGLAYTRVLKSYREELNLRGYFIANRQEAALGPAARERILTQFREWVGTTIPASSGSYPPAGSG